jgi:hypothetical protein
LRHESIATAVRVTIANSSFGGMVV